MDTGQCYSAYSSTRLCLDKLAGRRDPSSRSETWRTKHTKILQEQLSFANGQLDAGTVRGPRSYYSRPSNVDRKLRRCLYSMLRVSLSSDVSVSSNLHAKGGFANSRSVSKTMKGQDESTKCGCGSLATFPLLTHAGSVGLVGQ